MRNRFTLAAVFCAFLFHAVLPVLGQSSTAAVNGQVRDTTGAILPDADVEMVNELTNVKYPARTNSEGIYSIVSIPPGPYRMQVSKPGFKTIIQSNITLNVLDARAINFELPVGAVSEIVTVEAGTPLVNTESATVSTVVDRNFAENLPMNGRSFQTLIDLTPGVVLTVSNPYDGGQFSVNGQRASSNYWMVDGVGANIGMGSSFPAANGASGSLGSFSVQGGTNGLVSVDAMQEFRIQTSTFAPEFGRTPGAQISIVTRQGTNQLHGTAFDYLRNDALDANNWFNGYTNNPPLPKAEERQNDFGGTLNGPILRDRTFFFFSYEGLRLRLPETELTTVPDLAARQNASVVMQPYLNAYPLPNPGQTDVAPGISQFNASFSNASTLDAYSLRVDHRLSNKLSLFGRYNYSPSALIGRGGSGSVGQQPLSNISANNLTIQTATVGLTSNIASTVLNDVRFNYSKTAANNTYHLDDFGGAIPLVSPPFPSPYTNQNGQFNFGIESITQSSFTIGKNTDQTQRQFNAVDNVTVQQGSHSLKFGIDLRRLSPILNPYSYAQIVEFPDVPSAEDGNLLYSELGSARGVTLRFRNLGVYAQDTWRCAPSLTLTYGVRWDVDFPPSSVSGPSLLAVNAFNLNDLSALSLAPSGTPPFETAYGNVAPRLGVAYQLSPKPDWQTVVRGGAGMFFDLATDQTGNFIQDSYPFQVFAFNSAGTFPLSSATSVPPPITPANLLPGGGGTLYAFEPGLRLPYTLQWNVAIEQGLGEQQTFSVSYIGAGGRRLVQTAFIFGPSSTIGAADVVTNAATSDYEALQLQFRRRLSRGLQALVSYTWAHSIDTASAGSYGNASNTLVPSTAPNANRGPSDFDIRNALSTAFTYDLPTPRTKPFAERILKGWSTQNIIQARSAPPVDIYNSSFFAVLNEYFTNVRPDVVAGQPFYLRGSQYPGGRAFNPAAFTNPPVDPSTGAPLRQGDLPRNFLRGFGATQWDFAVHRDFPILERLNLQFRAEMFNVLNHPNFAPPTPDLFQPQFGLSTEMLAQSLGGGNVGGGGLSPLYQLGGPRSIQLAVKLQF
jgi:hypothetical protein